MIYTVTFNPSLDYVVQANALIPGRINRTIHECIYPGGKGNNVSVVLSNLGRESIALGFVAGFTGDEIEKLLKYSKKNKLSDEEIKNLKAEHKHIYDELKKQRQTFLRGGIEEGQNPEQNSTYKVISNEFLNVIPSQTLTCLNQEISSSYKKFTKDIKNGERSIPNFKKGLPVPFPLSNKQIIKRNDGSIYIKFPKGLEWDLFFGRDRSNNREIVERILSGEYIVCNSNLQEAKNKKIFLLLVVKIPKQNISLDKNRIVGVDLGINTPLYAALNDNKYGGMSIGSRDEFHRVSSYSSIGSSRGLSSVNWLSTASV